jgi:hypothetical protein
MPLPRWRELVAALLAAPGEAQNRPQWRGGPSERLNAEQKIHFFQIALTAWPFWTPITRGKPPTRE